MYFFLNNILLKYPFTIYDIYNIFSVYISIVC